MKRLLSLLLFASLFCFGSCKDPDMDIDIDGYRYSSVRLGGVETYFNRSNRGSIVYFCSRNCDGTFFCLIPWLLKEKDFFCQIRIRENRCCRNGNLY